MISNIRKGRRYSALEADFDLPVRDLINPIILIILQHQQSKSDGNINTLNINLP